MAASAASDAVQLIVAYTPRRRLRCDGEDDYRITVLTRAAFNTVRLRSILLVRLSTPCRPRSSLVKGSGEVGGAGTAGDKSRMMR
jgi:hypothetical protein